MKKVIQLFTVLLMFGILLPTIVQAQDEPQKVTIKELNTYPDNFLTNLDFIPEQPLAGGCPKSNCEFMQT